MLEKGKQCTKVRIRVSEGAKIGPPLTRALMGLWIFHHLMWGGGNPLVTRLLDVVARNQKMRSKIRRKKLRKYSNRFFAKVNIEVTRGHKWSNLAKFHISSEM